ncbi:SAM-dependent methyltransferase [Clostridium tetanomorphum]|uniref:class I SAM-dependent methyltransferase n=1 Tax=Clostridium tetanomorphum TaxID=1553 RepID=UPI00044A9415|nr:SAM-dependent methyltransferase [Clostridium tetanomorphum]KAJ49783.1 SAM dependent methyltransferase [Clostridium tetanomorphum DSM 665]MBP1866590.1 SAM-dependent methyltransferase [Clostridium tetanomorphum]NRS86681.1 SAM-dependent methyltransferase [Clostridium tetanomorphum]SQC00528.1 methylase involved in ubiquinone/menaquinone biosynthesis [Clostridium tetanomorphum]
MNKQNISKLNLFLMGLENRFIENKDIFIEIVVKYTTGLKNFKGIAVLDNNNLAFNFNGLTQKLDVKDLIKLICKEAENYDSVEILYKERGTYILIQGSNKKVNMKNIDVKEEAENKIINSTAKTSTLLNRDYYIKVGEANKLLKEIGIMTEEGKIKNDKIRKYNQIDHYVELLEGILDKLPMNETINILDCGCGKSYLTFVLNYYLTEVKKRRCNFIGLDISESVISSSKKMAENLNYRNMEFKAVDIKNYLPNKKIHVIISLHACDTATDMALALGIRLNSDVIIAVPCCHRELLNQYSYEPFNSILKHGIFKTKMADILTDGMRSLMLEAKGYDVSVVEYISPLETPKNLMIRAIKTGDDSSKAMDEYMSLMSKLNVYPALYDFLNNW